MSDEQNVEVAVERESVIVNAPWWLVSAGLHMVVMLGMTLIYVERLMAIDDGGTTVVTRPTDVAVPPVDPDAKRDDFTRRGIPKDDGVSSASEDPIIFFPDAELSDHNESADGEDYRQMKGDSKEYLSYTPGDSTGFRGRLNGKTPGVYDTMGTGGGGGASGRHGGPWGGRKNRVNQGPRTQTTESALMAALKWLAHHQDQDGSWKASGFTKQCIGAKCGGAGGDDYDAGLTALSLLAFLGAGYTHLSRDEFKDPIDPSRMLKFGVVVKGAMQWLISRQDPEGCIGERGAKYMYNHAVAALAISEAYGMTSTPLLREPAQKAIDFLVASQNVGKGWRYSAKCGDNDTSVSGWALMALKSAALSELSFPQSSYDGMISWLDDASDGAGGYVKTGYTDRNQGKTIVPGKNEHFDDHPSMTAVAIMSRIFIKGKKGDPALSGVHLLAADLPEWKANRVDFYYWYYASLAMFQYDGPDGALWNKWNEPMKNAIVPNQKTSKDGCQNGSWNPDEDRWGFEGGRVYAVAINALTLEVYYRYPNVFGGGNKK